MIIWELIEFPQSLVTLMRQNINLVSIFIHEIDLNFPCFSFIHVKDANFKFDFDDILVIEP